MRNILLFFISLLLIINVTKAQEIKLNPFSGRWVLTAEGGLSLGQTDYMENKLSHSYNGLLEYFFSVQEPNILGLRLTGGTANIKGKDSRRVPNSPEEFSTNIQTLGLGLVYSYSIQDAVFPYAYGGISLNWFNPLSKTGQKAPNNLKGVYDNNAFSYDIEAGFRFKIAKDWTINASGGLHFIQTDYLDDVSPASQINPGDFPAGPHYDLDATAFIGVSFAFPGEKDSDGDGIPDSKDLCPDTPRGVLIDETGCPLDNDGDGVPDYLDKCPQTAKGVKVDKDGCALDSDKDGIPDNLDKCPNTPGGVAVDKNGCPLDSDGDGVADYLDKCPDTKFGLIVDSNGCSVDSDQDGVPDSVDKCPDTPIGVKVDQFGCEIKEESPVKNPPVKKEENNGNKETKPVTPNVNIPVPPKKEENTSTTTIPLTTSKIVIYGSDTFEPGTVNIKTSAYPNLDNIVSFLQKDPWTKWKIQGYVDSQTPDEKKLSLSYEEADAIMKYFVSKGLPSFQFQVYSLGDESPIAPNSTPEGRSKNRRVELVKIKK